MRTIVYIDGFNFYYALKDKKKKDIRWANFNKSIMPDTVYNLEKTDFATKPPKWNQNVI